MHEDRDRAEQILDTALELGERHGWDAVHLHDVARQLGIVLAEIHQHYGQKDDLAEAWFDRADRALIRAGECAEWDGLSPSERLARTILAWFDALAPHRKLSVEMMRYKMQPDHLHLQIGALTRISRTVQWIRETARLNTVGWRREVEEVVLTGIFLGSVGCWLLDRSPDASRTRAWLDRQLSAAERVALHLSLWTPSRMR